MKKLLLSLSIAVLATVAANAQVIFTLDGTSNLSLSHTTSSPLAAGSQSVGNGTFSWGDLASDTTANTAVFSGGSFQSSDWGGVGTFTSTTINVNGVDTVDIAAQVDGLFNVSSEYAQMFYSLDGGATIELFDGDQSLRYTDYSVVLKKKACKVLTLFTESGLIIFKYLTKMF
jgi:hypothetical protein